MAIVWGGYSHNFRLGLDLVGNTMILYGESNNFGFNFSNGTVTFGGDASGSKTVAFYSGYGQTVRKELHRWSIGSGTYTATANLNHYIGGVGTINASVSRTRTVTPKPAAPTIDRVVRNSDTSHKVEWTRNATYDSVRLERRTNGGAWQHVSSVSSNAASITDTTTKAGNRYQYRVRGANAGGTSDWSNLSNTIYTTPPVPGTPVPTRVGNDIRVAVSMPTNSSHLDIQDDGTTVVSALAKGSLPWLHGAPNPTVTHRYRARSRVATGAQGNETLYSGWSGYSATVQLTAPPSAPTNLTPNGEIREVDAEFRISWNHNPVDSSEQTHVSLRFRHPGGAWHVRSKVAYAGNTAVQPGSMDTAGFTPTPGVPVEYQVQTWGVHPDPSPWSAVAQFTVISKPTVTIQAPSAGDFHEAVLPVSWSFFQGQGRPQSSWRARLLRDGQILETKQGTGSATSTTFSNRLEDGHSYTVEVDAASGSIWSAVESVSVDASFILPAPAVVEGVWNEGTGAVDLQVSILDQPPHADVVNYAPRIEGDGTWAEVRRNLARNPNQVSGGSTVEAQIRWGWATGFETEGELSFTRTWATGSQGSGRGLDWGGNFDADPGGTGGWVAYPVEAGVPIQVRYSVRVSKPSSVLDLRFRIHDGDGLWLAPTSSAGSYTPVASEWTDRVVDITPTHTGFLVLRNQLDSTGWTSSDYLDQTNIYIGAPGPYFGGSTPDRSVDPDMRQRWLGEPNASESVMEIERVRDLVPADCIPGVSVWEGEPAVRLIPVNANNISRAGILVPAGARSGGTVVGEVHVPHALTGVLDRRRLGWDWYGPQTDGPTAPNVPGSYLLRGKFSEFSDSYFVRLWHGGALGSGDVWWSGIGLFAGDYQGESFDGDTEWVEIDGVWMHTRWNPDGTSTASMPDDAVLVTVERSVDGGITWALVADNLEAGTHQLTDPMALSNGVTIYRVTTYAATGAATVREFPVTSDSGAVWVGGGVNYSSTVRLPYSPQIEIEAGRERVLKRYSGRSRPVVYSGEQLTRTVDTKGLVRVNDEETGYTGDLERVAQLPEPTHLYRDPEGRHVVGMLSNVVLTRENHYWWAYGFLLTETEV